MFISGDHYAQANVFLGTLALTQPRILALCAMLFATLVGLELRPRKMREAAAFWERLTEAAGVDARDGIWQHPDLLPDADDLDEPAGFIDRVIGGDTSGIDEAIAKLEREGQGPDGPNPDAGPVDN